LLTPGQRTLGPGKGPRAAFSFDDWRLCGIVSIGDLVKNRLDEVEFDANSLRSFTAGA